jgi:tetratricopeptide (TPR) repeat protein
LVIVAYLPVLHAQFIWDDDLNVTQNVPLRSLAGLGRIWFQLDASPQYYPLTYTSFWLDYHLWGWRPMFFHAENVLLHALSAVLVWRILRRLDVPGAWLGAALFALHPVCVETVAWVTERRNTLSAVFFLASILVAIEFWLPRTKEDRGKEEGRFGDWKFYWLALFLYLCGLLSKTAVVGLPAVILLLVWWKRRRLPWKVAMFTLPFFALGVGMSLITVALEHQLIVSDLDVGAVKFSAVEKIFLAGRVFWFYLEKIFWPCPLMSVYPRWTINVGSWPAIGAVMVAVAAWFVLWRQRRDWARAVLVAVGYFAILIFPALGFIKVASFRYSFVADHFQYLATIGPLALAAAAITCALGYLSKNNSLLKPAVDGILLLTMGWLTWQHAHVFHNSETLWRHTLAHNPNAWMAHDNLGIYLSETGHFDEADAHYNKALEIRPNDHIAYYNLGLEAAIQGELNEAAQYFTKTLELAPGFGMAYYQLGNVMARNGNANEAIDDYTKAIEATPNLALAHFNLACALARKGEVDNAIHEFTETEQLHPGLAAAPLNLGNLLVGQGKLPEAIEQFHNALDIDPNSVDALASLGNALISQNQPDEAVFYYKRALEIDPKKRVLHNNLAVALARLGRMPEAQAEMAEAQRLETTGTSAP